MVLTTLLLGRERAFHATAVVLVGGSRENVHARCNG